MNNDPGAGVLPLVLLPPGEDLDETYGATRRCEDDADRILMPSHEHNWPHPRVAVGSGVWTVDDVRLVRDAGITHVLDCRSTAEYARLYRGTAIAYCCAPTDDDGKRKPPAWFGQGVAFALDALSRPDAKLLVHCAAGINRGPSMAYAVLRAMGLGPTEAEGAIRSARPLVSMGYRADAERWVTGR